MKKFSIKLAMLALALVVGLTLAGCSDDGGNVDDDDDNVSNVTDVDEKYLSILSSSQWGNWVELTINGVSSSKSFVNSDFAITINGTPATVSKVENQPVEGNLEVYITFTSPSVTIGTRYTVSLVYSGNAVTLPTRTGTVTCKAYQ